MVDFNKVRLLANMMLAELGATEHLGEHQRSIFAMEADCRQMLADKDRSARLVPAARRYAKLRHERKMLFQKPIFADPAWDILIDLFSAEGEGKRVSVTSACAAADVPATTALRWLGVMEREGLIERHAAGEGRRGSFLRITPAARDRVATWFELMLADQR